MTIRTLTSLLATVLLTLPLRAQQEVPPFPPNKPDSVETAGDPAEPGRKRTRKTSNVENELGQVSKPGTAQPVLIVQLEVAIIAVPKTESLALAERFKSPATAEEAYRALAAKVQAGQAKLIGCPTMESRSGIRAVVENITEVRYAVQYQPAPREAAPAPPANNAAAPAAPVAGPATALLPTTFETRSTGITFEAEPVLGADGKTIDVQLAVQHVQFLGWDAAEIDDKIPAVPRVPQPSFHCNKLSTNMSLQVGQRALAGVFTSATDPETMEFFILTVGKRSLEAK